MSAKRCYLPIESVQQLSICKAYIYEYLDCGESRSFKLGQRRLIPRAALATFRLSLEKQHTAEMRGGL